jgi:hypothetical protein
MTKYVFYSKVKKIEEKTRAVRSYKTGKKLADGKDEIRVEYEDLGWFILLEDSWESIHVGREKPDLEIGRKVKVTIEADET